MSIFARTVVRLLTISAFAGTCVAQSASTLPKDPSQVFRTIVSHRNALPAARPEVRVPEMQVLAPPFSGSPYTVGATITPTSTIPEAEEHIAVDPNNFNNLISMISDFSQNGGFNLSKFAFSSNNGASWTESFVPTSGGEPVTADGHIWQANSDPVVAIDKLGNAYLANLYLQVDSLGNVTNDGYYVCSAKLTSGPKFTKAGCHAVKTTLTSSTNLEDKEWLTVDNGTSSHSGNVYACWTHFTATSSMIEFSRSTNHGVTWSKAIQISSASQNGAVQGSQCAVAPDGTVYVAYEVFLAGTSGQQFIAKSTNGGTSFSRPVAASPTFTNLTFSANYRDNSFPAMAVGSGGTGTGFVYIAYAAMNGSNSSTEFIKSKTAGGTTFTTPVAVNDKTAGQRLMPAVAADTNGDIHLSWFDSRNSSNANTLDIYATYSKDNGSTFATNARVTSKQITTSAGDFIGDYSGIAAGPNGSTSMAHPAWTSAGLNEVSNLQTATLTVP